MCLRLGTLGQFGGWPLCSLGSILYPAVRAAFWNLWIRLCHFSVKHFSMASHFVHHKSQGPGRLITTSLTLPPTLYPFLIYCSHTGFLAFSTGKWQPHPRASALPVPLPKMVFLQTPKLFTPHFHLLSTSTSYYQKKPFLTPTLSSSSILFPFTLLLLYSQHLL